MDDAVRRAAARAYCNLAALVRWQSPGLAERLVDTAARVLAGETPAWDDAAELACAYATDN